MNDKAYMLGLLSLEVLGGVMFGVWQASYCAGIFAGILLLMIGRGK